MADLGECLRASQDWGDVLKHDPGQREIGDVSNQGEGKQFGHNLGMIPPEAPIRALRRHVQVWLTGIRG